MEAAESQRQYFVFSELGVLRWDGPGSMSEQRMSARSDYGPSMTDVPSDDEPKLMIHPSSACRAWSVLAGFQTMVLRRPG